MKGLNIIHSEFLKSPGSTDWNSKAMTTATATYYSDKIKVQYNRGFAALLVNTSAGSLAITMEVSLNGDNWYTPYDTDGNNLGTLENALTADKWIVFDPQLAGYIRFKFVLTGANSTVSAKYIQQE